SVAYSPDGQHIVSGSSDKTIRIWNASTGQLSLGDWCPKDNNGWICTPGGSVICWIPHWARNIISDQRNTVVIDHQQATKVDFTDFVYGKSWTQCWA
ncbi:hypothetical protein HYDPIDRAFT_101869, partial [Hydnomerulius pinastri MD-312]